MFEDRIAKGVALLDQKRPGWENEISLVELDLKDPNDCVLGQVYGSFGTGANDLKLVACVCSMCRASAFEVSAASCGFDLDSEMTGEALLAWNELTEAWKHAITDKIFETYMGNIGEPVRHIELEPLEEPSPVQEPTRTTPSVPATPASPVPSETPVEQPQPV